MRGRFRREGGVSAGMRLAPEVASGGSKDEDEGSNRAPIAIWRDLAGGMESWRGQGLCKVGGGKRATGAGDEHATASETKPGAALSERAPIPDRKQLIKSDFPGRAPRVARYSTSSIRVQR